ncbi:hypothetical protein LTR50_004817 [Elasticomyces elasticus]|nr:hypothetical protein LTR50_004817 [Elasticomyces elasticus]
MPARKRARQEVDEEHDHIHLAAGPVEPTTQLKLRNMWEFANLRQYMFFFGKAVKVDDDLDVEGFEAECLNPSSDRLAQIALALLKYVSSHRGLTLEIFDEYCRRQYVAKAPKRNPFGEDEEPARFAEFDVFTKVRVLQQLSTWTLGNADRIREKMPERDSEQTQWVSLRDSCRRFMLTVTKQRIEPFGWDANDCTYYLLDDDRLYRRTDPPVLATPVKPKSKVKSKKSKGTRASKRRKISTHLADSDVAEAEETEDAKDVTMTDDAPHEDDGFGGMTWECIAATKAEYEAFLESMRRSRDINEKALHKRLLSEVMPTIEKSAEAQRQKLLKKQREQETLQKMVTAKRSSRVADRLAKQKEIDDAVEAERKRKADLQMARREQEKQLKMEKDRESRMMTREQRLKEREIKRILHEEELAKLEENSRLLESNEARMSERHLKLEMERRQKELEKLAQEDQWVFDCAICGMHGENLDDGTHSIACEKCNIWQHSKCHGIRKEAAERDDFHFVCRDCKRKEEDSKKPKIPPLRLRIGGSSSPKAERSVQPDSRPSSSSQLLNGISVQNLQPLRSLNGVLACQETPKPHSQSPRPQSNLMDGPSLSPHGQSRGPPGYRAANGTPSAGVPQQPWTGNPLPPPVRPPSSGYASSPPPVMPAVAANGYPLSPPRQHLHQQAHASAMASANFPPAHPNGSFVNGYSMPPPSPHQHGFQRQHDPYSNPFGSPQRPTSSLSANGLSSPSKSHHATSPPQAHDRSSQYTALPPAYNTNTSFPPPAHHSSPAFSPAKPISTPQRPHSPPPQMFQPPSVTPSANNLVPTKHDTPRPPSSYGIGGTPVYPPNTNLSPTPSFTANTPPVKKLPEQAAPPAL